MGPACRAGTSQETILFPDRFLNKVVKNKLREVLLSATAATMSQFSSTAALPLPQLSASAIESCVLSANEGVTDGARTRDLRSHNPTFIILVRTSSLPHVAQAKQNRLDNELSILLHSSLF